MDKRRTGVLLAALVSVGSALAGAHAARADVIVSLLREPGPVAGTDAVSLYALGSGGDATLVSYKVSVSDLTSSGLVMGNYQVTTGPTAGKGFYTDITGSKSTVANSATALGASAAYSWIGNGQFNPTGFFTAWQTPDTDTNPGEANVPAGPYATSAANPYTGPLASFHVEGGWTTPLDASAATAGTGNGAGALIAVAVVPKDDVVNFFGQIGGSATTLTFDQTNPQVVPEPASLGLLAFGGAALLARRKRRSL